MRTTVLGVALLAATALISATPASAAPEGRWTETTFLTKIPTDALFATHNGSLPLVAPGPPGIPILTDPLLRNSFATGVKLRDATGNLAGIATEIEEILPDSDPAQAKLHTRTLWTLFLPHRGSITIEQRELTDEAAAAVFLPAMRTGQPWVGDRTFRTTEGNSGVIVGGAGEFAGIRGTAVEFDRIYRFDPKVGELVGDVTIELRYQVSKNPLKNPQWNQQWNQQSARGPKTSKGYFVNTPGDIIALTHNGEVPIGPFPATMPKLTEPALRDSFMLVGRLRDASGKVIGLVTELEYQHPDSDILAGRLRNHSLWTFVEPGKGVLAFDEDENQDRFATEVVLPVLKTGKPWTGHLSFPTTVPGTGKIVAGTGRYRGARGTGIEQGHLTRFDLNTRTLDGQSEVQLRYHH